MATEGQKYERLHDFLKESFKTPEFQRFLRLKGFEEVAEAVDRNVGGTEYFFDVVEALDRWGRIDTEFFDRLAKERPAKETRVRDLKEFWLNGDAVRSPIVPDPAPAAPAISFVPGCTHDVFVSSAPVDDLPGRPGEEGWVTTLIKRLKTFLAQRLGVLDEFSLWFDPAVSAGANLTPEVLGALEQTATFLVILSPGYLASPWCRVQRDRFLKLVQDRRREGRVFLIERDQVELEDRPAEFGDLRGHRFWVQDRIGRPPRILGLSRSSQDDDAYHDVLNDLVWDLSNTLKSLRRSPPRLRKPTEIAEERLEKVERREEMTVYLAEATDDLDPLRTKLTRSLQQRNLRVIPESWYPRDAEAFREEVEDRLKQADLFVQLLSAAPGRKPPGLEGGYVGFQHARARAMGLPILQWRSPALDVPSVKQDVEDAEHRALLLGASVQAVDIEDFGREIVKQVERAEQERRQGPPPDAFVFVNVDHDDQQTAHELCRYFEQRGIEYALPIRSGEAEEVEKDREDNLVKCDGMIVVYGRVSSLWVRRQLRDFRELALARKKKARALAIYHGPPPPKDALGVFLRNLMTIDCTAGMEEARLRPFLEALQQEVVA
jgi:hypothetical protein